MKAIDKRLTRLEAKRAAVSLPAYVHVASIYALSDAQLEACAAGRLTVYIGCGPDDWDNGAPTP